MSKREHVSARAHHDMRKGQEKHRNRDKKLKSLVTMQHVHTHRHTHTSPVLISSTSPIADISSYAVKF